MKTFYKVPLIFEPQPEGGYTVTSPLLPELITEGDTLEEARNNAEDALQAVLELYEEMGISISSVLQPIVDKAPFLLEAAVAI